MLSYTDTLDYLYGLEAFGIRPGLSRVKHLLRAIGNPEDSYPSVLVAGTNGKGSVAAMLSSILVEAGYKAGLYTSPHIHRFNERIRVSGTMISSVDVKRLTCELRSKLEQGAGHECTFFEFTTAMALKYFEQRGVDIAVVEVGMGGRLDATNVLRPEVTVITSIGLDHCAFLGDSIEEVASEKAGVMKGSICVSGVSDGPALGVIEKRAKETGTELFIAGKDFRSEPVTARSFDYMSGDRVIKRLGSALSGPHQVRNAACAIKAAELLDAGAFDIGKGAIMRGLRRVEWPARFEVLSKRPKVVLDSAHNPGGAAALAETLKGEDYERLLLVFGVMANKDIDGILSHLIPLTDTVIITEPEQAKSAPLEDLIERVARFGVGTRIVRRKRVREALKEALAMASNRDMVCVAGSIFTVSEARRYLIGKSTKA